MLGAVAGRHAADLFPRGFDQQMNNNATLAPDDSPNSADDAGYPVTSKSLTDSPVTAPVVILLSPVLAVLALRLPSIAQNNFTDAMFYLGYSENFVDLIDRYGFMYYAVRFGPIFPEMAFASLCGPSAGFHLLRYLLFIAVAFLLHAVLAERYGRRAALLGIVAWGFNPVTARILLSTYVDSTVVPLTMVGLLLLLLDQGRSLPRAFLAGVLLCAGASGNVYAGVMIALALPAYVLLNGHRPRGEILCEILAILAGSLLTLLVFTAIYDQLFGVTSLVQPAIDVSLRLAGGDAKQWTRPPEEWLFDSPHIYAPFLVLIAAVAVWRRTRDRLALAGALYLLLFIVFYWISDLVFDGYSLSFYPYFSYWQAALMLGIGVVSCQALRSSPPFQVRTMALLLLLALAAPAILFGLTGSSAPRFAWLAATMVLALLGVAASLRWAGAHRFALIGLLATASLLQAGSPIYNMILGKPQSEDRETVRAALDLIALLPRIAQDGKDLAFWYSTDGDRRITMVQSVYLPFSRLHRPDRSPVELGELSASDAELLTNPQLAHLIILDFSPRRVDDGLGALDRAGIPYRLAQRHRLGSKRFALEMAHVILEHPNDPLTVAFAATAIRPHPDASMRYDANGAMLTTGTRVRNWDGTLDLQGKIRPGAPITVSVTLQVLKGRATLALIQRGQPDRVVQENVAAQTHAPVSVAVRAADGADVDLVAIRNGMEDGTAAVIRINSVTIRQPEQQHASISTMPH